MYTDYTHAEHCSFLTSINNWLTVTSNWHSNSYSNTNSSNWHYKNNDAFVLNKIKGTNSNDLTTYAQLGCECDCNLGC